MVQVEFDASVKNGHSYLGFIIIAEDGNALTEKILTLQNEDSSVRAELFAAVAALQECKNLGITKVHMFGDCLEAIRYLFEIRLNRFNNKKVLSSEERRYIGKLIRFFEEVRFYHFSREINWRAHSLVENGEFDDTKSWGCLLPDFPRRVESRLQV